MKAIPNYSSGQQGTRNQLDDVLQNQHRIINVDRPVARHVTSNLLLWTQVRRFTDASSTASAPSTSTGLLVAPVLEGCTCQLFVRSQERKLAGHID